MRLIKENKKFSKKQSIANSRKNGRMPWMKKFHHYIVTILGNLLKNS